MVRCFALWLLYLLPACSESILCRSIEIYNKYTNSAFVGSCYLHWDKFILCEYIF
jgi:hypothetical protein